MDHTTVPKKIPAWVLRICSQRNQDFERIDESACYQPVDSSTSLLKLTSDKSEADMLWWVKWITARLKGKLNLGTLPWHLPKEDGLIAWLMIMCKVGEYVKLRTSCANIVKIAQVRRVLLIRNNLQHQSLKKKQKMRSNTVHRWKWAQITLTYGILTWKVTSYS